MADKTKTIELLNEVLTAELTAINQYFLHAELCQHWGYTKLYGTVRAQSIGEMKHAEEIMERILFLDGIPNVQRMSSIKVGETVAEQFTLDLGLEQDAIPRLNEGIAHCREVGDNGTAALLQRILESEEEHVEWLETQINLIGQLGEAAYLAQQI